jgi:hypothetical protein
MARDYGRIFSRIWDDKDFLALDQAPQRFYFFLLTQKNLSKAGVLPVTLRRWANSAADLDSKQALRLLSELDRARFVVWDDETEEVLIRTFIRGDEVYKLPNVMQTMVKDAAEIMSPKIRRALLAELDRIPLDEVKNEPTKSGGPSARATVEGCIETLRRTLPVPEPTPDPKGPGRVPERDAGTLPETDPAPLEGRVLPRNAGTLPDDLDQFAPTPEASEQVSDSPGTLPETLPSWVPESFSEGSRARACAYLQEPDPSANPSPPARGDESPRQQPLLAIIEGGAGAVDETPAADAPPETVDQLIGYWIRNVPKRPPGSVIGRVGKHIKTMLGEGIAPADIAAGLEAWATRGKDPSTLPSIVNEVMNATRPRAGASQAADDLGTEAHLNRYLARAAARKAREA